MEPPINVAMVLLEEVSADFGHAKVYYKLLRTISIFCILVEGKWVADNDKEVKVYAAMVVVNSYLKSDSSTDEDKTKFLRPIKVIAAAKRVIPGIKKAAEIFFDNDIQRLVKKVNELQTKKCHISNDFFINKKNIGLVWRGHLRRLLRW